MTKINGVINGIVYANCESIDTDLQGYCPLEHTEYEALCINDYHTITLRPEGACEHSLACFNLRAKLNSQKLQ